MNDDRRKATPMNAIRVPSRRHRVVRSLRGADRRRLDRRNWIVLAIGALLLAISMWNTLALIRGPTSN